MRQKKKLVLLLAMTLIMVILTGCMQNVGIQMNSDGSGTMTYSVMVEKATYKYLGSEFCNEFEKSMKKMGYKKTELLLDGEKYVDFGKTVQYSSLSELKSILTKGKTFGEKFTGDLDPDDLEDLGVDDATDLRLMRSAHITKDTFQGVHIGSLTRDALDDGTAELYENFSTRISITFPNEVQSTNGEKGSDGKTVTWSIEEGFADTMLQATTSTKPVYPVDNKAPVIKGIKDGKYYDDWTSVELDDNIGIKSATVNGKKMGTNEMFFNDAKYNITVKDFAGNTTKATFFIDSTDPTVKGVKNNAYYNTSKKITFSDKNGIKSALLNGKSIKSGKVVSNPGSYKLSVTDPAGNDKEVKFIIDKKKPTVTGVTNGKTYTSSKTIKFSDNRKVKSATLNGQKIKSGKKVTKKGSYSLIVTDYAGNKTTVKFSMK